MTLIATLVSETVLVQVSDRRISLQHKDGAITFRDDMTNKAILYENRATFAFSGRAELEGKPTDIWVAERLAKTSPDLNAGLENLTAELTTLFRRRAYRGQFLAVVIAGWRRNGSDEPTGFSGLVCNQFEVGRGWQRSPADSFDWFVQMTEPPLPTLVFVPDIMSAGMRKALYRQLLRVKSRGLNVVNAVDLIADSIRSVSQYSPAVGKELMVAVLPRSAVPRSEWGEITVMNGSVNPETPTFWNISAAGDRVAYGPTMIMNGMIMTNFRARPI